MTDNLTRLIWMKNASNVGAVGFGVKTWADALSAANNLKSGDAGLTDGSQAGDWRLPNLRELQSLVDYGSRTPALPADHPFTGVVMSHYWSSTAKFGNTFWAWGVYFDDGHVWDLFKDDKNYVLCVRGGP